MEAIGRKIITANIFARWQDNENFLLASKFSLTEERETYMSGFGGGVRERTYFFCDLLVAFCILGNRTAFYIL